MEHSTARHRLQAGFCKVDVLFRRLLLAVLVCCFLQSEVVKSQTAPEDRKIEITHQIAKDAVFTCTVKDLGKRRVVWSRLSDPYPISVGSSKFSPNRKYKVDISGDSTILTIKNIDLRDAGEYQCRVSGQVNIAEVIALNIQGGQGNTYLITTDTVVSAEVGDTVLLPCHVENLYDHLVLWKNSKNEVLTLRKKVYSGDRRHDVIHDTAPEWSLEIKNVRESDFGYYTCIINSEPVLTRTVLLQNKDPAQLRPVLLQDSHFRKRVEVSPGETVTLVCNFRANPPAKVTWYRRRKVDGKTVRDKVGQGNSFILESVTPEQSGDYICKGNNGLKPDGRGRTKLIVLAPATSAPVIEETTRINPDGPVSPQVYPEKLRVGQRRGMNVEIKCAAVGLPRPNIHWSNHGRRLGNDHKYNVDLKNFGRHTLESVLLIRSVIPRDYGLYRCEGYSQLGMTYKDIELYEIS